MDRSTIMIMDTGTVEVAKCCLSWTVYGLSDDCEDVAYGSPPFSLQAVEGSPGWRMRMWPHGLRAEDEGRLSIGFWWREVAAPARVQYQVSLFKNGCLTNHSQPASAFTLWPQFIERAEVLSGTEFLNNNQLKFHVKFWRVGSAESVCPHIPLPPINQSNFIFTRWYNNRFNADMTVKIKHHKFKIHKLVFASRSRVFGTMFEQDMSESNTGCLILTDITPQEFLAFDEFMYTGRVTELDRFAADLVNLAEKYELQELKIMCELSLMNTISKDTAFRNLALAKLYNAPKLKKAALDFMKRHGQAVTSWEGWTSSVAEEPQLISEVFRYLLPTKRASSFVNERRASQVSLRNIQGAASRDS